MIYTFNNTCITQGAEICKNIVLSGVNSLTILDTRIVEEKHSASNFLIRTSVGKTFGETSVPNLQILVSTLSVLSILTCLSMLKRSIINCGPKSYFDSSLALKALQLQLFSEFYNYPFNNGTIGRL